MNQELNFDRAAPSEISEAMATLVRPGAGYVGCTEALLAALGLETRVLVDFRSVPLGELGERVLALRYLLLNGSVWRRYFAWQAALERAHPGSSPVGDALFQRLDAVRHRLARPGEFEASMDARTLEDIAAPLAQDPTSDVALDISCGYAFYAGARRRLRARLAASAARLVQERPETCDLLLLLAGEPNDLPASTVAGGCLRFLIVADKGEMGARAVREAVRLGLVPVPVYSETDDQGALAVRLAEQAGGFAVPLSGTFRESYANPVQIAERVTLAFRERFAEEADARLAEAALYPGYGPLAENTVAIAHFRRSGIAFVGPTEDAVARAGDKRRFRALAESIDPGAVTPGITLDESDPERIAKEIEKAHAAGRFAFPGRIKAANGGGGRGQAIVQGAEGLRAAIAKVLAEIQANGWDPGVMFEQNIFETTHLEVQIVRDRFGNTRHFGMRDCTEQRASQKIQEEAPPALLSTQPELEARMCAIAVEIADRVGYLGACTVELMYKDGRFYLLEMNTRIQVEHPVTEEAHGIVRDGAIQPLNLVELQLAVARGLPLDFAQSDVQRIRVAREYRINAESYKPDIKDPRDGRQGLFLPNGGIFDVLEVPSAAEVKAALEASGIRGIQELGVRFDTGFEAGDRLVNKDPTFGKLIVSVAATESKRAEEYELLRLASLEVLRRMRIEGRQVTPAGKVLSAHAFETNLAGHIEVLESELLQAHSRRALGRKVRHVGWVIEYLRQLHAPASGS